MPTPAFRVRETWLNRRLKFDYVCLLVQQQPSHADTDGFAQTETHRFDMNLDDFASHVGSSGRRVFQYETKDRYIFKKLMKTIMSDPDMEETLRFVHSYIVCIKVKDVDSVDGDTDFILVDENLTDTSLVRMFHRYIQTLLNPEYETLKEAIKVHYYQENQYWLNTITDDYKDTLMEEKRREKNRLTRKSMLNLICKSEDKFKTSGALIKEMVKVFECYRVQIRIYNGFERLIF